MFFARYKPSWLYATLPKVYLAAGMFVIFALRSPLGAVSGLLLIAAAVAILLLRARNRRQLDRMELNRPSVMAPPSRLASTAEFVRAILPPELGHHDIDRQHRSMASRTATLQVAWAHNDDEADIEMLVGELLDFVELHIQDEAKMLKRLGVARTPAAVAADLENIAGARRDVADHAMGGMTMERLIERIGKGVVAGHLLSGHPPLPSMQDTLQRLREAQA